ncbi:MAG: phage integrase N-terminal SAM-like domain-containing protein, partial [Anaerolineales bacterium]|nr:phage integrase N-terminal SAM-like domain-containing protein [Anaerolineales bacterium]
MDHSSSGSHGSMGLKKAILGFVQAKEAEALSPRTIQSYQLHLETWAQYMGERSVNGITAQDVRAYLAYLRTEYV